MFQVVAYAPLDSSHNKNEGGGGESGGASRKNYIGIFTLLVYL